MSDKRTEIADLGEFGLIEKIKGQFQNKAQNSTKLGIGDDAAIITPVSGHETVVSTDMLMEGVHFDLAYTPLQHLGYKAVSVNVSDIAAMNAIPTQITLSVALSNRFSLEAIDWLYQGVQAACRDYNIDLVGGDTTSSRGGLLISVTVLGISNPDKIVLRSGAQTGDILCCTGDLGAAYVGLQVLEREKQVYLTNPNMQPELDKYEYIVERQLKVKARTDIIHELRQMDVVPTSMIDISDGLASEILHICQNSGISARIFEDKIPIHQSTYDTAVLLNLDPITCALNGGEDYELLFTIKQSDFQKIEKHDDIQTIGFIQDQNKEAPCLVTRNDSIIPLSAQGWKHF